MADRLLAAGYLAGSQTTLRNGVLVQHRVMVLHEDTRGAVGRYDVTAVEVLLANGFTARVSTSPTASNPANSISG